MSFFRSLFSFSRKEINEAFKGARLHATYPGLKILKAPLPSTLLHGKLLISIPKQFGNAPKRNKLRRQLKSIYHQKRLFENLSLGIILVQKMKSHYSFEELEKLMIKTFSS